jgi:type II secretory pathway pseudopilin PulG
MAVKITAKQSSGFTLVELLIVMGIITAIFATIIIAVDPLKRLSQSRNSKRWQEARSILEAIVTYAADHSGYAPTGLDATLRMLGTATSSCSVSCGGDVVGGGSFGDSAQAHFNLGTYSDTQYDAGNGWLELTAVGQINGSGNFTSRVFDATSTVAWSTLAWTPERPLYKELPNNGVSESAYPAGNANMTGIRMLLHANETSGAIVDYSGLGNNGTSYGGVTYGVSGKLNTALGFDGTSGRVEVPNVINGLSAMTIEAWFRYTNSATWRWVYGGGPGWNTNPGMAVTSGSNIMRYHWRTTAGSNYGLNGSIALTPGTWYHIAYVYNGATIRSFINGSLDMTSPSTGTVVAPLTQAVGAGYWSNGEYFYGSIDEVVIYNRDLSPTEISDHYKRGALRLRHQVRSCDDSLCAGETFMGPDGTASTYYSELNNSSVSLPSLALSNVPNNRYFQYKAFFETDSAALSPEMVSITMSSSAGGEYTAPACLDLTPYLVEDYIAEIPMDPLVGSRERTYYAAKRTTVGRIKVMSCNPELGEDITVQR